MPVKFQWTDKSTGQGVLLFDMDEILCKECGIKPHPTEFSTAYDTLVWIGISAGLRGDDEDKDRVEKWVSKEHAYPLTDQEKEIARKFLYQDYSFATWR